MARSSRNGLAEFIAGRYGPAGRIVEVGVGENWETAEALALLLPDAELVVTDWEALHLRRRNGSRVRPVFEDVQEPSPQVYQGARLVYAIHPPPELVPAIERLGQWYDVDILAVPLSDDVDAFRGRGWDAVALRGRVAAWIRRPPNPPLPARPSRLPQPEPNPGERSVSPVAEAS